MISYISFEAPSYWDAIQLARDLLERENVIPRIWSHDHTVWKPKPDEIANRLGWLDCARTMQAEIPNLQAFADSARRGGFDNAVLLGMGGSSLAPEVFAKTLGPSTDGLPLQVLDSTDPGAVLTLRRKVNLKSTLVIVSTKSGGTTETISLFKYLFNEMADALGSSDAAQHFIAITDAGSSLDKLASTHRFRQVFHNDPNIGGRYSALSHFGLVPAALCGIDLTTLLAGALREMEKSEAEVTRNAAALCGAVIATSAQLGHDKLTFITPEPLSSFGDWVEQLIAESTGKDSVGIVPIAHEPPGESEDYDKDRLFVLIRHENDLQSAEWIKGLVEQGHPAIIMTYEDVYDLGGLIFFWEMATAIAGHLLGIQPFDQPNVESAKVRANQMIESFHRAGRLPEQKDCIVEDEIAVYGGDEALSVTDAINQFVEQSRVGDYIAIQAYLHPTSEHDLALLQLRLALRTRRRTATTVGYGPRFLHSTGQLHKGDRGNGLFLQITCDDIEDVPIPDGPDARQSSLTFGTLKMAQALGDYEALRDAERRVIRVHLGTDTNNGLQKLIAMLR